jgi:hypothetical protein
MAATNFKNLDYKALASASGLESKLIKALAEFQKINFFLIALAKADKEFPFLFIRLKPKYLFQSLH